MKSSTYDDSSGMPATPEKALCGSVSAKEEPAWKAEKAALDAMDDGEGPYMDYLIATPEEVERQRALWVAFKLWADHYLGQGYSLACADGSILDFTTRYAYEGFKGGKSGKW
jgi:hypothetical protein